MNDFSLFPRRNPRKNTITKKMLEAKYEICFLFKYDLWL